MTEAAPHPAVYSQSVLDAMAEWIGDRYAYAELLDPFAGVGRIHELADMLHATTLDTVGVEIEPEWAQQHPNTIVGDATKLPQEWTGRFDIVATSPTYANRMADHHNAQEKCKPCNGTGTKGNDTCEKCEGVGRRAYKRIGYKFYLGRDLHPQNTGQMQWSEKHDAPYKVLHRAAWEETYRVLKPGGWVLLNISNHIRKKTEVDVSGWHIAQLERLGFWLDEVQEIQTPRMRFGANADARVDHEKLAILRKS